MGPAGLLDDYRSGLGRTARARDVFLSEPDADLAGVRPIIARSWFRSRAAGVDALIDRAILDQGRVDEYTLLASGPNLQRLDAIAADMGGYVSLTAPNGGLVRPAFLRDEDSFPEGYSLLEASCGSNGEGLALEEGRGVWLAPEEHFREDMRCNWCFASLIRDPFHNRVRGVIGLTLPAARVKDLDPSSTLLMLEGVAARIEREIEARASSRERVLLSEYLTISRRRGNAAVIAMDGRNSLMNAAATASLEDTDFSIISGYARTVMSSGRDLTCEVMLKGAGAATLEVVPVELPASNFGAIVTVRPLPAGRDRSATSRAADRVDRLPIGPDDDRLRAQLHGASAEFERMLRLTQKAVEQTRSVALVGEFGSGKRRIAGAIASIRGARVGFDADDRAPGAPGVRDALDRVVSEAAPVLIIEQADKLSQAEAIEVANHFTGNPRTSLILTITHPTDGTLLMSEACDALEIPVAPLRNRREDIAPLASAIAEELGDRRLSRKLVATLTDSSWPRNVAQLRAVVSNAVERAQGPEVTVDDLPQGFRRAMTDGRLTRLEDAELSELQAALQEAKGNRRLAAEMLQIGRSTLYRRMDYFRGRGFDL